MSQEKRRKSNNIKSQRLILAQLVLIASLGLSGCYRNHSVESDMTGARVNNAQKTDTVQVNTEEQKRESTVTATSERARVDEDFDEVHDERIDTTSSSQTTSKEMVPSQKPMPALASRHRGHHKMARMSRARRTKVGRRRSKKSALSISGLDLSGGSAGYARVAANQARVDREISGDRYAHNADNKVIDVSDQPKSTFSIDVDTASYTNVRRQLREGQLPVADAVRIEELINYFDYDYPEPVPGAPFSITTEVAKSPWHADKSLVMVGLKAAAVKHASKVGKNLVFLIDVSGSMNSSDKLGLLKKSFPLLVDQLTADDRVSIVVYAGASGLVLPPTTGAHRGDILAALDQLQSGGSTNGADGIELAYQVARENFVKGGINRVILATDGDFNVGPASDDALVELIESKRKSGVSLTVLGFGAGNLNDSMMEKLADKGNGNYAYVDSQYEAKKVLVREAAGTLVTVAKDVKIQVEFNPAQVKDYRLVGYTNRVMANRDFADDTKDAGDIGSGHDVTALYEITPGKATDKSSGLRYQSDRSPIGHLSGELLTVALRYKKPQGTKSTLLTRPVYPSDKILSKASTNLRWAAAVASFGRYLRLQKDSRRKHIGAMSISSIKELAEQSLGADSHGDRKELIAMIDRAAKLRGVQAVAR